MWEKIKNVVFHRAVQHGAATAAAAVVAYLSRPDVLQALAAAGVTVDPTKLSPAVVAAIVFALTTAYHLIRKKVESSGSANVAPAK